MGKNKRGKKKAQAPPPPPPKANGESELQRKQAAKNDGKQGGNDVDKISRDSNHAAGNSFLEMDESKKKAPKKADPPYKKWAEEAKAFPKKHLKAPSPQQKKSKKKAPVTKKDIKKYAGNTGDVTQMEIEDKELRAKAKWGGMYRKVNHKSIMHKKEVKAKKEKKIVIHHYGKMEKKNKRGKKKAQ